MLIFNVNLFIQVVHPKMFNVNIQIQHGQTFQIDLVSYLGVGSGVMAIVRRSSSQLQHVVVY